MHKKKDDTQNLLNRLNIHLYKEKSYPSDNKLKTAVFNNRYFSDPFSFSITVKLNRIGVEYALKGKLDEAKTIFNEILIEDGENPAALNNTAVICELLDERENAFYYYSNACLADPENEFFIRNFLLFCDNSKDRTAGPFGNIYTSKE